MNGEGKKHTLRFDPRTELLLLVLANIVAFTQHSVWVEITWVIFLLLQNRTPDGKRSVDTANASEKLKTVLDYIHLHYAEPLTVAGLAAQCYFSEYYFMRFFKKHMNKIGRAHV